MKLLFALSASNKRPDLLQLDLEIISTHEPSPLALTVSIKRP